ncbi:MAG: DUF998 domain-containing protein [Candidatus Latescibacteria bacterium]|jgi:hypothetical protein|nr:DUF998 domain-containing protein [Candidatus Latescibacterota bacterium]
MGNNNDGKREIVSYLTLRRVVGIMGVLLPVALALGCLILGSCTGLHPTISDYYGTAMRDVFVGILFVIGWFLFSYRGYQPRDNIAGDLACLFALGVALFPTTSASKAVRAVHFISAAALFLVLAYFSLSLFTKTKEGKTPTCQKKARNRVYVTCGVVMLGCIGLIALYEILPQSASLASIRPVFWLESLALWAFGFSWFVKGETLWRDVVQGSMVGGSDCSES